MTQGYDGLANLSRQRQGIGNVAEALRTQETFDRTQVAWLMHNAYRWGYEQAEQVAYLNGWNVGYDTCAAEWTASAAAEVSTFSAQDVTDGLAKKWLREQCDAMARTPRPGDHLGGAVAWDEESIRDDQVRPSLRVAA